MGVNHDIDVQSLWEKYEDIAMHFNDLLMRLRSQSLAGIAAASTIITVLAKGEVADVKLDWLVAKDLFLALSIVWVAIWCLDFLYYNRLLMGSVRAIKKLETQTKTGAPFTGINMSTLIEDEFRYSFWSRWPARFYGVILFYVIVLGVLVAGMIYAQHMGS
jgi:hypothetical protein